MKLAEQKFEEWLDSRDGQVDEKLLEGLQEEVVLVKYGGNAMVDEHAGEQVLDQIALLSGAGMLPVVVHGGGPSIRTLLEETGHETEFIEGHRRTDGATMRYVEMALSGEVNGRLVRQLNSRGVRSVGLSGKDASMVRVQRRFHRMVVDGEERQVDIGYVGNVSSVDPSLVHLLLENGYLPVISPIAVGEDGNDYNVNADMFAGHLAGALHASVFLAVTDVDGLRSDPADPDTRLDSIAAADIRKELGKSIQGGMIPKVESCLIALGQGVEKACIVHGMKPDRIVDQLLTQNRNGTTILP